MPPGDQASRGSGPHSMTSCAVSWPLAVRPSHPNRWSAVRGHQGLLYTYILVKTLSRQ
jgi:hypothetical protein